MGLNDLLKKWADDADTKRYGHDPTKLAQIRDERDAERALLDPPEPDLDLMTDGEIEVLRLKTEDEIASFEKLHGSYLSLADKVSSLAKPDDRAKTEAIGSFASFLSGRITDYGIGKKRELLHKIAAKQRSRAVPPVQLSPAQLAAQKVAEQVSQMNETVTLLEQQCEAEVKQFPHLEQAIRRRYRKAIDAILDQA